MFDDCLIMAGGSGTRLWPASNSRLPKQFLPATGKQSFFSLALERALALTKSEGKVIIIAGKSHVPHVIADAAKLKAAEKKRLLVISEPAAKNTAPAIACALVYSQFGGAKKNMLVLTSDHIIKPLKVFKADASLAAEAVKEGKLAVFGIAPSRPETGYGYIETGKNVQGKSKPKTSAKADAKADGIFEVKAFHEKPDLQTAKKYTSNGKFFWNSGMFAFSVDFMIEEFRRLAPEVILPFAKLKRPKADSSHIERGIQVLDAWSGLENAYNKAKSISFDYAIAEKCQKTLMVRTNFDWIDVGNWEEYVKICENSQEFFNVSSKNCHVDSDIPVALAGVDELIVVIRSGKDGCPPIALVTKKGQTQKVRDVVDLLKKAGKIELL